MNLLLTIDPVPECNWGINLSHLLPRNKWDIIRKNVYRQYNYKCGICGTSERLNCHEIWVLDDDKLTQKLAGLIALCKKCHDVKHLGRSIAMYANGTFSQEYILALVDHFLRVNKCTMDDFLAHQFEVKFEYNKRRNKKYIVDFGILDPIILKDINLKKS